MPKYVDLENYTPAVLLDALIDHLSVRNDARLAKALGVGAPVICKIRGKESALSGDLVLRIHDLTGISVDKLRELAGIPRAERLPVKASVITEPMEG